MTRRRVAIVAPPWYPIPPVGYGGIEVVVDLLVRGLRFRGIDVLVYGAEGSRPGTIELAPASWSKDLRGPAEGARAAAYACRVLDHLEGERVDVVHDHIGYVGWTPLVAAATLQRYAVVHTVHGPLEEPDRTVLEHLGDRIALAAISHSQRAGAPGLNWAGVVHNAADADSLRVGTRREREPYLLCLARISPQKGQHLAIELARRAGMRLVLAGKVGEDPGNAEYFRDSVQPHIDGDRVSWLTNVWGAQKRELLARAHALVAPLCWPEPFGLAVVEAMMSGTPAIATPTGAMPELIDSGDTGFLAEPVEGMLAALRRVGEIDPVRCAALARQRFSPQAMADGYLRVYEHVAMAPAASVLSLPGTRIGMRVASKSAVAAEAAGSAS